VNAILASLSVESSNIKADFSSQIYLGMETREQNGESKALSLIQEFAKRFRSIDYTMHPGDIPGEAAGKGSNMAWAARKLSAKYPLEMRRNVVITGIDGTLNTQPAWLRHIYLRRSLLISRYSRQPSLCHLLQADQRHAPLLP
jgi:hypothetical protein